MFSGPVFGMPARHAQLLLLCLPVLFAPAFIIGGEGYDQLCQGLWVKLFSAQLWSGDLYPRWLQDMYVGNGSPVFFYYPPLAYFITSFFTFLSPLAPYEYYPIAASAMLATGVAGIAFYRWMLKETGDPHAALLGSILYVMGPACVAYGFYFGLAFATIWVYAWLPFLLMSAGNVAQGGLRSVATFAFALFLLIMTNLPLTLIWGPIAVAYCLLHFRKGNIPLQALRLAGSVLLGFGLSAFYLMPALSYLHFTIMKRLWTDTTSDYHNYFLHPGFDGFGHGLYTFAWALAAILLIVYWRKSEHRSKIFLFFLTASAGALFMMLPVSESLWDSLNIMKILQFPMRFFLVPSLGLAVMAALALPRLRRLAYALIAFYVGAVFFAAGYRMQETDIDLEEMYRLNIEQYGHYLTSYDLLERYYSSHGLVDAQLHNHPVEVIRGDAACEVKQWIPRHIALSCRESQESVLRIRQFYFPGFSASSDAAVRIGREGKTGQVLLDVPPGEHEVHVDLASLAPERNGGYVSAASLAVLLFLLLWKPRTAW